MPNGGDLSEKGPVREALLYEQLPSERVKCHLCQRRCLIEPNQLGYCSVRINRGGRLYTLSYGLISTYRPAPMEIKPLFHFHPGEWAFSLGSWGCNFRCIGCQNWEIAHIKLKGEEEKRGFLSPERAISMAKEQNCQGISFTYNEPTIWFEYCLDTAKLAKEAELHTSFVTNGFITPEALDLIGPHLGAYRVDVKSFSSSFYRKIAKVEDFHGILEVAERAKLKWGMHLEVVTNLIPGLNDSPDELRELAGWIRERLGSPTPWHITRFFPYLKLSRLPPTPVKTLEKARGIGMEEGLDFVYLGNLAGHPFENTYCPSCGELLIERRNTRILSYRIEGGSCPHCGRRIPIVEGSQ